MSSWFNQPNIDKEAFKINIYNYMLDLFYVLFNTALRYKTYKIVG